MGILHPWAIFQHETKMTMLCSDLLWLEMWPLTDPLTNTFFLRVAGLLSCGQCPILFISNPFRPFALPGWLVSWKRPLTHWSVSKMCWTVRIPSSDTVYRSFSALHTLSPISALFLSSAHSFSTLVRVICIQIKSWTTVLVQLASNETIKRGTIRTGWESCASQQMPGINCADGCIYQLSKMHCVEVAHVWPKNIQFFQGERDFLNCTDSREATVEKGPGILEAAEDSCCMLWTSPCPVPDDIFGFKAIQEIAEKAGWDLNISWVSTWLSPGYFGDSCLEGWSSSSASTGRSSWCKATHDWNRGKTQHCKPAKQRSSIHLLMLVLLTSFVLVTPTDPCQYSW